MTGWTAVVVGYLLATAVWALLAWTALRGRRP
jgi:hypothetical protein